uniref:Uncharacterized protein n=1 Tax=Anguilla anguilla TaxID=7936 RepID=A0A0E9SCF7_ANGAN
MQPMFGRCKNFAFVVQGSRSNYLQNCRSNKIQINIFLFLSCG